MLPTSKIVTEKSPGKFHFIQGGPQIHECPCVRLRRHHIYFFNLSGEIAPEIRYKSSQTRHEKYFTYMSVFFVVNSVPCTRYRASSVHMYEHSSTNVLQAHTLSEIFVFG